MDIEHYQSMTQEQLRELNAKTGALLLLDVPEGLQFGIDNIVWKTGSKFKGVKFIPLGAHIISYSLQQQNHQFKINKFLIFDLSKGPQTQIIVLKWSFKYSLFLQLKGAEAEGYRQGVRNYHFDSYLGPYPLSNLQFWKENTGHVTRLVLQKLEPVERIYKFEEEYEKIREKKQEEVRVDVDEEEGQGEDQGEIEEEDEDSLKQHPHPTEQKMPQQPPPSQQLPQLINKRFQTLTDTIYYSEIPRLLSSDPSHISKVNLNKTELLIQVITKEYLSQSNNHKTKDSHILAILGELQYSFVYFLIGQDLDSLQQWKKLVNLIVFSEDLFQTSEIIQLKREQLSKGNTSIKGLIDSFETLSLEFIVVLYNQIRQFPADFFMDQLSKNSFMESCLRRLNEYRCEGEGTISKKVKKRVQKLLKLLSTKFNYEPQTQEQQDDEDAPVVVLQSESYF